MIMNMLDFYTLYLNDLNKTRKLAGEEDNEDEIEDTQEELKKWEDIDIPFVKNLFIDLGGPKKL